MADSNTNDREGKLEVGRSISTGQGASGPRPILRQRAAAAPQHGTLPGVGRPPVPGMLTLPDEPAKATQSVIDRPVEGDDGAWASATPEIEEPPAPIDWFGESADPTTDVQRSRDGDDGSVAARPRGRRTLVEEGTQLNGTLSSSLPIEGEGGRRRRDHRAVADDYRVRRGARQSEGE